MSTVNATTLRRKLARILKRAGRGERFVVLRRNRPVCEIVPLGPGRADRKHEPLYRAKGLGASTDGRSATDHDEFLYGWRRR